MLEEASSKDQAHAGEVSGGSMYNSFRNRGTVPGGKAGEDPKMYESSPRLMAFEDGPSHRMHTFNTRKSQIQPHGTLNNSLKRLGEFRHMIDKSNCPKYKMMKE